MALTNFIITVGVIGAAAMLLRTDIRHSGKMLQRNMKTIRSWVEEAQEGAFKAAAKGEQPKKLPEGKLDKDA